MLYSSFTANAERAFSFVIIRGRRMESLFITMWDFQMKSRGNLAGINIWENAQRK